MAPPTRDFAKRPKAKVGKRAPAKINSTDTSFKTTSVGVRSQGKSLDKNKNATGKQLQGAESSAAARMELASSRGNALSTLQASLRHHAPAVRASGLRGIRDAVQSLSSLEVTLGISILEANLPSLLPNMCRCWLDEDDDARRLAVCLFGDILKNIKSSSEQADLKCLAPFVPFLCAYASSALNSLDRSVRKDGALLVGMLASSDPSPSFSTLSSITEGEGGNSAMAAEMGKHVDLFIPSLERLLSSMSFGGRGRNNAGSKEGKKRKRDKNNSTQPASTTLAASDSTLLSLALLLRASLASGGNEIISGTNGGSIHRRLEPSLYVSGECSFLKGGSAHANSLLLFRESGGNHNDASKPIRSIMDLPLMATDELVDCTANTIPNDEDIPWQSIPPENDATKLEKIQRLTSLLETLRMKFVELTHSGRKSDNDVDGLIMSIAHLETIDVLVQTTRLVHCHCQSYQTVEDQYQIMKQSKTSSAGKRQPRKRGKKAVTEIQDLGECLAQYKTTVTKALALLLETFPFCPLENVSTSRYELTNAGICSALAELGGDNMFENSKGSSPQWMNSVFSHIIPRLNSIGETKVNSDGQMYSGAEGVAANMLLKVVSKLLLPHGIHHGSDFSQKTPTYLLNNPLKRHELLEAFAAAFFPRLAVPVGYEIEERSGSIVYISSDGQKIQQLASKEMGKTAAILLRTLLIQSADHLLNVSNDEKNKLHEKNSVLLLQMSFVLPMYLVSWEGRLPFESGQVLASFIAIVRQWSEYSGETLSDDSTMLTKKALDDLCLGLRFTLEALYVADMRTPSIFERLPEQVQKLCVGLVGLLKCPSETLGKYLSNICSKSFAPHRVLKNAPEDAVVISNTMANYVMEVMHSLRKTIPMALYLTFLVDSCGIKYATCIPTSQQRTMSEDGETATDPVSESVFSYDRAIGQLCRFLTNSCDEASTKVLPMILPILQKWLSGTSASTGDAIKQLVQARAAISILAAFTWDEVLSCNSIQKESDFIAPRFLKLDEKNDQLLIDGIMDQFEISARLWSMERGDYIDDLMVQQQYLARLLGPITVLLRYRGGMFGHFAGAICKRVVQHSQDPPQQDEVTPSVKGVTGQEGAPCKKINAVEVHLKALLQVLKSKEPASIVDLVRNSDELPSILMSGTKVIQKAVSGGHLAHLGSKLLHQAKLCKP